VGKPVDPHASAPAAITPLIRLKPMRISWRTMASSLQGAGDSSINGWPPGNSQPNQLEYVSPNGTAKDPGTRSVLNKAGCRPSTKEAF